VLHVDDVAEARRFYEQIVGLRISKESVGRVVFEGLLALEPLPRSLRKPDAEQLALDTGDSRPSFDTRSAVTLYVNRNDFGAIRERITEAGLGVGAISTAEGRPTFRCLDPDGNVVEFRCMSGGLQGPG
jgi:catechol 2,3-dioxygenase-like lactoylglutathione lyase family enzyme